MSKAIQYYGLSCPQGGSFHVCEGTKVEFVGCCTSDPCANDGKCPQENLRLSSFDGDKYEETPPMDCDTPESINQFYTCKFNAPPFFGCCASNACANGTCEQQDLRPIKLSGNADNRQRFLEPPESDDPGSGGGGLSGGAIGGIVAGVVVVVLIAIAAIMYKCGWHASRQKERKETAAAAVASSPAMYQNEMGLAIDHGNAGSPQQSNFRGKLGSPPIHPPNRALTHSPPDSYLSGFTAWSHNAGSPSMVSKMTPSQHPSPNPEQNGFQGVGYAPTPPIPYGQPQHGQPLPHEIPYGNGPALHTVAELDVPTAQVQELPANAVDGARRHHQELDAGPDSTTISPLASPLLGYQQPDQQGRQTDGRTKYYD